MGHITYARYPECLVETDSLLTAWRSLCYVHSMYSSDYTNKGLLIYGASGEGKSCLASHYAKLHPKSEIDGRIHHPVLMYRFKEAKKTTSDILKLLIDALGVTPPKGRTEPGELDKQFKTLVKNLNVELIILDEIQQVLPNTDGVQALNTLKYFCALLDELPASIVFIGSDRAMRLLKFGELTPKNIDDNEQLSRRMLRPIKLERFEPKTQKWLDCVNWYMDKLQLPALTVNDGSLLNRIYIAYIERSFSTLECLFLRTDMSHLTNQAELIKQLHENYQLYCQHLNPFDETNLSAIAVNELIEDYTKSLKSEQS